MHTAATAEPVADLAALRHQARIAQTVVRRNVEGLTHEDSLRQPAPGGNCLNWIVGHLAWAYAGAVGLVGQETSLDQAALARYARGGEPITDPAQARDLSQLLAAFDEGTERFTAGLATLPAEALGRPAPASPSGDPNETVRSLLATILFHQSYHAGQTGVLRRLIGRSGAIK
jgi:hypothetical protein